MEENLRLPIACNLSDREQTERRTLLSRQLLDGVQTIEELSDGYAFSFPGEQDCITRLAEFVAFERKCCPFLSFELLFEDNKGPIRLRLRGGDAAKQFVQQFLQTPRELKDGASGPSKEL
ncbi:MAG TPA: hypothetical protein VGL91_11815 [Acidobacteriota bacterium]